MAKYKVDYLQPREMEVEAENENEAVKKFREKYGHEYTVRSCRPKHSHKEYEEPLDDGA